MAGGATEGSAAERVRKFLIGGGPMEPGAGAGDYLLDKIRRRSCQITGGPRPTGSTAWGAPAKMNPFPPPAGPSAAWRHWARSSRCGCSGFEEQERNPAVREVR